jgi:hypothetical protein
MPMQRDKKQRQVGVALMQRETVLLLVENRHTQKELIQLLAVIIHMQNVMEL